MLSNAKDKCNEIAEKLVLYIKENNPDNDW